MKEESLTLFLFIVFWVLLGIIKHPKLSVDTDIEAC